MLFRALNDIYMMQCAQLCPMPVILCVSYPLTDVILQCILACSVYIVYCADLNINH